MPTLPIISRVVGSVTAFSMAAFLWFHVRVHYVQNAHGSKPAYLSSGGIGIEVTAAFLAVVGLFCLFFVQPDAQHYSPSTWRTPNLPVAESELWSHDLHKCFGRHQPSCSRLCKFSLKFLFAVVNPAFIIYTFCNLPPRDPTIRLNEARYIVSWAELVLINFWFLGLIPNMLICGFRKTNMLPVLRTFTNLADFSSLKALSLTSPVVFMDRVQSMKATSGTLDLWFANLVAQLSTSAFFLPIGLMSFFVKINQIDFVTEKFARDFTLGEWFQLFGFLNNLFAIIPKPTEGRIHAILAFLDADGPRYYEVWIEDLGQKLRQEYGSVCGFIILSTLTTEDVSKLLNSNLHGQDVDQDAYVGIAISSTYQQLGTAPARVKL